MINRRAPEFKWTAVSANGYYFIYRCTRADGRGRVTAIRKSKEKNRPFQFFECRLFRILNRSAGRSLYAESDVAKSKNAAALSVSVRTTGGSRRYSLSTKKNVAPYKIKKPKKKNGQKRPNTNTRTLYVKHLPVRYINIPRDTRSPCALFV